MEQWCNLGVARRGELKNLRRLSDLCISTIINHMPVFCKAEFQPFKYLPREVMEQLYDALLSLNNDELYQYESFKYAQALAQKNFFTENTQRFVINIRTWSKEEVEDFLEYIKIHGQDSLRNFQLEGVPAEWMSTINLSLRALTKLELLDISTMKDCIVVSSFVSDETLKCIGANLTELRELGLLTELITDQGIKYLCVDDGVHGKCKKLEVINKIQFCSKVTKVGLLLMLENLPNLRVLTSSELTQVLLVYKQKHEKTLPNFRGELRVDGRIKNTTDEDLSTALTVVPNLRALCISGAPQIKSSTIVKPDNLTRLELECDMMTNTYVHEIVTKVGAKLKVLKVKSRTRVEKIDISSLVYHCPNLEELDCACKCTNSYQYPFENIFPHIEIFKASELEIFPHAILKSVLKNPNLKIFNFFSMNDIFNQINFREILLEAVHDKRIFSNLEQFGVFTYHTPQLSLFAPLVCLAPKLEKISIYHVPTFSESPTLKTFLRSFNTTPQVDFNW